MGSVSIGDETLTSKAGMCLFIKEICRLGPIADWEPKAITLTKCGGNLPPHMKNAETNPRSPL